MPSLCLFLAVTVTALVVGVAVAVLPVGAESGPTAAPTRPEVVGAALLRDWDLRRARAWAAGDPAALRGLYTAGSPAGRTDRSMLRRWRERGLRVEGLRMQLLRVRVRSRSADRVVLVVSDRLAGGVAVGDGVRRPLPRDAASTRTVTLRRAGGGRAGGEWRVSTVVGQAGVDQARPVRTTSSTTASRNR